MDDQPLDLSVLDRHGDPKRCRRQVAALAAAALKPEPPPFLVEFIAWSRGAVAAGALLALVAWLPAWTAARPSQASASRSVDPVLQVAAWAQAGAIPADAILLDLAGASDAR